MLLTLATLLFFLAAFDAWLTVKRMNEYGLEVELNKWIKWLATRMGPELGCVVGILVPALLQVLFCNAFGLTWLIGILVGLRLRYWWIQLESIAIERMLKKAVKENKLQFLNALGIKVVDAPSPDKPSSGSVQETPSSPSTTPSSEKKDA